MEGAMRARAFVVARSALRGVWIWSFVGALVAWVLIGVVSGNPSLDSLRINATLAAFLALVGLGQMLVVTGGGGGIDLSIPFVITLSAYWSSGVMNGDDAALVAGLAVGLGVGLSAGLANAFVVVGLGIPPIVGTLAIGFVVDSAVNVYASRTTLGAPSPALAEFVRGSILGIPSIVLVCVALAALAGVFLHRTVRGRQLVAAGQSEAAAALSGVAVARVRAIAYVVSGVLAGFTGVALAGYNNGAFLNMGDPYLLASIGAVVLGGSLIAGGRSTAAGTLGGALFLTLIVTLMVVSRLEIGLQYLFEGLLIILVLIAARGQRT
jgi:ribose transport system permease protein